MAEEVLLDGLVGFVAQVFEGDTPGFLVDCLAQPNNVGSLNLGQPAAVDRGLDRLLVSVKVDDHQIPIGNGLLEVSKGPRAVGGRCVLGQHGGKDPVQEVRLIATITGLAGAIVTAASNALRNNIFDNVLIDLAIAGYVCGDGGLLSDFTAFLYHVRMELSEFPHGEFTLFGSRSNLHLCLGGSARSCSLSLVPDRRRGHRHLHGCRFRFRDGHGGHRGVGTRNRFQFLACGGGRRRGGRGHWLGRDQRRGMGDSSGLVVARGHTAEDHRAGAGSGRSAGPTAAVATAAMILCHCSGSFSLIDSCRLSVGVVSKSAPSSNNRVLFNFDTMSEL
jgi:hypothetical protein